MFSYVQNWMSDPKNALIMFLLAFPGRILALSVHEFAHAWMANRCGDPTAKMMGRMTMNPFKHLDLLGALMMMFLGFGWARPVPVNPRNFRNYRRDDLKVSVAGVCMNFIMFIVGCAIMYAVVAFTLFKIPALDIMASEMNGPILRTAHEGFNRLFFLQEGQYYYMEISTLLWQAPFAGELLVAPVFGTMAGHLYDMLGYFVMTNLVLGIFNMLPVPPLDGYHVLNDLLLRRTDLFARERTARICSGILMVLIFTGVLGEGLVWVEEYVLQGMGYLAAFAMRAMGLMA